MKLEPVIRDVKESNIDDVFRVCSQNYLDDPEFAYGFSLKRKWIEQMLKEIGSVVKIAYIKSNPVAQLMFYPETVLPYETYPRVNVIRVECAYNAFPEMRGKGIGDALMQSLIQDSHKGLECLNEKPCRFLVANAFNTGEGTSLEDYYKRNGFQTGENELYLPITGVYEPKKRSRFKPFKEDRDKALLFFNRNCQFSYRSSKKTRRVLNITYPNIEVEMIEVWERPEKYANYGNEAVVVNTVPIKSLIGDLDEFKLEVLEALQSD